MLDLQHIRKCYSRSSFTYRFPFAFQRTRIDKIALHDVTFSLRKGEILGLLGRNGAGKSTLIKLICGLIRPTSGRIVWNGKIPTQYGASLFQDVAVVFGNKCSLWWDLPLKDSLRATRYLYKIENFEKRFDLLVSQLDLKPLLMVPVRHLSLGERVKGELAFNLMHSPQMILLDEPTIGLDLVSKHNLRTFLSHLTEQEKTSLIVTSHDMNDIEAVCQNIILIEKGCLILNETYQNFLQRISPLSLVHFNILGHTLQDNEKNLLTTFLKQNKSIVEFSLSQDLGSFTCAFDQQICSLESIACSIHQVFDSRYLFSIEPREMKLDELVRRFFQHREDNC